jgi:hypothetical protein
MLDELFKIIGKVIPDKGEEARLKAKIQQSYDNALTEGVKADKEIRLAEMKSDSFLQSRWRPIAALVVFLAIFVRFPLYYFMKLMVGWFDLNVWLPELEDLPQDFYMMATAFISIYAYGRSQEKRFK